MGGCQSCFHFKRRNTVSVPYENITELRERYVDTFGETEVQVTHSPSPRLSELAPLDIRLRKSELPHNGNDSENNVSVPYENITELRKRYVDTFGETEVQVTHSPSTRLSELAPLDIRLWKLELPHNSDDSENDNISQNSIELIKHMESRMLALRSGSIRQSADLEELKESVSSENNAELLKRYVELFGETDNQVIHSPRLSELASLDIRLRKLKRRHSSDDSENDTISQNSIELIKHMESRMLALRSGSFRQSADLEELKESVSSENNAELLKRYVELFGETDNQVIHSPRLSELASLDIRLRKLKRRHSSDDSENDTISQNSIELIKHIESRMLALRSGSIRQSADLEELKIPNKCEMTKIKNEESHAALLRARLAKLQISPI